MTMISERPLEPPESEYKPYVFTCNCSSKIEFTVWAKNDEEAKELLNSSYYEEFELKEFEIEDIDSYKIDD